MNSGIDKNQSKNFNKGVFYDLVVLAAAPLLVSKILNIVHSMSVNGQEARLTLSRLADTMPLIYASLVVSLVAIIIGIAYLVRHKKSWRYYLGLLITPAIMIVFGLADTVSSRIKDQQGLMSFSEQRTEEKEYSSACGNLKSVASKSETARRNWRSDISSEVADKYADQILEIERLESENQHKAEDLHSSICAKNLKPSQQDTATIKEFLDHSRKLNSDIHNNRKAIVLDEDTVYKLNTIIQLENTGVDPYQDGKLAIQKIRNYEARCSYPDHKSGDTSPGRCALIWSTTTTGDGISTEQMLQLFTNELSKMKNPISS